MKTLLFTLILFAIALPAYAVKDTVTISSYASTVPSVKFQTQKSGALIVTQENVFATENYLLEYTSDTIFLLKNGVAVKKYPTSKYYFAGGNTQNYINDLNWLFFSKGAGSVLSLDTTHRDSFILYTPIKYPLIYNTSSGLFEVWDGDSWNNED